MDVIALTSGGDDIEGKLSSDFRDEGETAGCRVWDEGEKIIVLAEQHDYFAANRRRKQKRIKSGLVG